MAQVITTAAIDIHLPTSAAHSHPVLALERVCSGMSEGRTARPHSHAPGSSVSDCGLAQDLGLLHSSRRCCPRDPSMVVQELLSSLSEDTCLARKGLAVDPVNLKLPSPASSRAGSPELGNRINIFNCRNQQERGARGRSCMLLQTKPLIHLQGGSTEPSMEEKHRLLGPADTPLGHLPDT